MTGDGILRIKVDFFKGDINHIHIGREGVLESQKQNNEEGAK